MDIKRQIEEKIKEGGHTKKDFADKMGVHPANLNKMIESPSFPTLTKIAENLNITLSELLRTSDETKNTFITCPHCGREIQIEIKPGS